MSRARLFLERFAKSRPLPPALAAEARAFVTWTVETRHERDALFAGRAWAHVCWSIEGDDAVWVRKVAAILAGLYENCRTEWVLEGGPGLEEPLVDVYDNASSWPPVPVLLPAVEPEAGLPVFVYTSGVRTPRKRAGAAPRQDEMFLPSPPVRVPVPAYQSGAEIFQMRPKSVSAWEDEAKVPAPAPGVDLDRDLGPALDRVLGPEREHDSGLMRDRDNGLERDRDPGLERDRDPNRDAWTSDAPRPDPTSPHAGDLAHPASNVNIDLIVNASASIPAPPHNVPPAPLRALRAMPLPDLPPPPPPRAEAFAPLPRAEVFAPPPRAEVFVPPPRAEVFVPPPRAEVFVPPPPIRGTLPPPPIVALPPPPLGRLLSLPPPPDPAALAIAAGKAAAYKQDFARAEAQLFPHAAHAAFDAEAKHLLACAFQHKDPPDFKAAHEWFTLAAASGHAGAMFNLARMYEAGRGVDADRTVALLWYDRAIQGGDLDAAYNLAYAFFHGTTWPQDQARAHGLFLKAAEGGHASAQFSLGLMHFNGTGVAQSLGTALRWLQAAAAQGHAKAMTALKQVQAA